ncbi:MOT12-like protein [Mya arenaria]|uniref:MOT12-like protein n=1 Tax=Mya arenaria TaxID=6604 RepID=A0ABY7G0L0_MYAAR|nr:MOT12-like protein [Mya arenaria]
MEQVNNKVDKPEVDRTEIIRDLIEEQSHAYSNLGSDLTSSEKCDDILKKTAIDVLKRGALDKAVVDQSNFYKNAGTTELEPSFYDNAPDGGWGWAVTFAAFMVGVILDGISFSFGIFYRELLQYFEESKSLTSWIISVLNGTYIGIGPIASILVTVSGCRPVAIFGAFLAAVSFFLCTFFPNVRIMILGRVLGCCFSRPLSPLATISQKKRALATGIAVCGSGIGSIVFAPLSEFLIEKYTWKGAMMIISAIVLNGIPIAALLRPLKGSQTYSERKRKSECAARALKGKGLDSASGEKPSDKKSAKKCCNFDISSTFDFELLKSPTFIVYGMSTFPCTLGFFIPLTYIPDLVNDLGMTSKQGAMIISTIGITNTVVRVFIGWLADRPWADAILINSVTLVIGGVTTMFVPMYAVFSGMATYAIVFGITVFVSYRSIIMAELLGIEKLTSSFGS